MVLDLRSEEIIYAGTCQVANDQATQILQELITQINQDR